MDGINATFLVTRKQEQLVVTYSVENQHGADIGLFNRIGVTSPDGSTSYSPENAYLTLTGESLSIRLAPPVIPQGLSSGGVAPPGVTRIATSERFSESIALVIPVTVRDPMRRALLSNKAKGAPVVADHPAEARQIEVVVGAFRFGPDVQARPLVGVPGVIAVWPPGIAIGRMELLTYQASLRMPLPVIDYRVALSS